MMLPGQMNRAPQSMPALDRNFPQRSLIRRDARRRANVAMIHLSRSRKSNPTPDGKASPRGRSGNHGMIAAGSGRGNSPGPGGRGRLDHGSSPVGSTPACSNSTGAASQPAALRGMRLPRNRRGELSSRIRFLQQSSYGLHGQEPLWRAGLIGPLP